MLVMPLIWMEGLKKESNALQIYLMSDGINSINGIKRMLVHFVASEYAFSVGIWRYEFIL